METETYLLLAVRLSYAAECDMEAILSLVGEVGKMLTALRSRLNVEAT